MFKNFSSEALEVSVRDSEIIELALSHGFKALDLDLADFAEQVATQGMAKASRLIVSSRLKIGSFRLPVRWEEDEAEYKADLERLPELAKIAEQMGCTRATTTIEAGSDRRPYHENFEYHRRRLAEMAGVLGAHKIRLGVGFLAPISCRAGHAFQFLQKFDELLLLLRVIGSNDIGVALDVWHWHLGGGTLDHLRSLGADKIVTVSLADADSEITAENATLAGRKLPGDGGAIDSTAVLTTLAELNYDGPVSVAPDKSQLAGLSRDKIVKNTGAALDRVWKAAGLNVAGRLATVSGR